SALALAPRGWLYALAAGAQVCFYAAALLGWLAERAGLKVRPLALPHYFVLANVAPVLAFGKFVRGERYASWETVREGAAAAGAVAKGSGV
ncbi:MAG TPA: hypothetical protein VF508_04040, partial [Pyrinomonadaceae bacterium]